MRYLLIYILFAINICSSQAWMTSLDIAQKLATVQNKMILMVWEETTKYPYPVIANDNEGKIIFIPNLYEDEIISPLIWKHFIPVIVSENQYANLYMKIKGKRTQNYIDKFNDDSIKIMDVNGNILNTSGFSTTYQNITEIIETYALNTQFIAPQLIGYKKDKNFYSAYYLASKYMDYALYANNTLRLKLIDLSTIYLNEVMALLKLNTTNNKSTLKQRSELLKLQQYLILKRPKKVLRQLKKIDTETIKNNNKPFVAFLYYIAYKILKDDKNAGEWKSKISLVNLKKAQLIINLNS